MILPALLADHDVFLGIGAENDLSELDLLFNFSRFKNALVGIGIDC